MAEKYVCIHCHFYQPPRENPWLEAIEYQRTAHPYHDWNERITEECYRRNAASRILSPDRRILHIINNYAHISFNFGPTLLYWLKSHARTVYEKIQAADRAACERFSGHGSALAQVYNHLIMPLANDRDKQTQVRWAIRDFQTHFGRDPEGMWLPETAVDLRTLDILAEHGIRFTILAPRQAARARAAGKRWKAVDEHSLDTSVPYLCNLPSGRQIALFFYNGSISHDVAYGGLLHSGENFASRLTDAFPENDAPTRLIHIATDGESFGHHHPLGDMALAYCLHQIHSHDLANITIYAEYLEKFPPAHEVQIVENSSWSCAHGVERWRSNCGCSLEPAVSGRQEWRQPLRSALDALRDTISPRYEEAMRPFSGEPWDVRDDYIDVINNRSPENVDRFISKWTGRSLDDPEKSTFLKLLEMQRNAMLMYTSCGWFFDEISGIEAVLVLRYAARAMQLCRDTTGLDPEPDFKERLKEAPCRAPGIPDGRRLYEVHVEPARVDLNRVAAQFALNSLFAEDEDRTADIYAWSAEMENLERSEAGVQILATGRASIRSRITYDTCAVDLAALYMGDTNVFAWVWPRSPDEEFHALARQLQNTFRQADLGEVIRLMGSAGSGQYSLSHMFRDQQRNILNRLLANTWQRIEGDFRSIYEHNYAIMQRLQSMNIPLPKALTVPAEFVIDHDLTREIQADPIDVAEMRRLVEVARNFRLNLDLEKLRFEGAHRISGLMRRLKETPQDLPLLEQITQLLDVLKEPVPNLNLQDAQNIFYVLAKQEYPEMKKRADSADEHVRRWLEQFETLALGLELALA